MSSLMSNDDNCMNYRIPRKKSAPSPLINSGSKSTTGIQSNRTFTTNQPAAANDILSVPIPRKTKDGAPSNNKKRTRDMSSIATTTTKTKAPKKAKLNNNENTSTTRNDTDISPPEQIPTYQIVKEGRVSGYPIIVSQVGSEHDAILLGCKATDNPQEYLNNNKDGKVKIRWKFAGYNGLVPTHTVRLIKLVDGAPPVRKAAVLSGLLETGNELVANDDGIDLGDEEDDDAPILKAVRTELLDSTVRADKEEDYNDQEDKDEKLVCYERSASVGYTGGKMGTAAPSIDNSTGISLTTNQVGISSRACNEEDRASANQESDNVEGEYTEFDPQVDEADTNSHKPTPSVVTSQLGVKSEDGDADSVATDPMVNEEVVPMEVKSEINVKTEGEETDDDESKPLVSEANTNSHQPTPPVVTSQSGIKADSVATDPMVNVDALSLLAAYGDDTDDDELKSSAVTSDINVKTEGEETDDEVEIQPHTSSNDVKFEGEAAYECDTDNDEPRPMEVTSDMNLKTEEVDTDNEMDAQLEPVASSNDEKKRNSAYECDTDDDEPKPLEVTSDMNLKTEEVDTDDEMDAQQVDPVASSNAVKKEKDSAYKDDTDDDEPKPLEVKSDMNVKVEEEDTDDEMNASSQNPDDLIPTVSASTSESEEDNTVVLEFFKKLNSCLKEQSHELDNEVEDMIKANPYLLNSKCPQDMDNILEGFTAMETVCQQEIGPDTRDLLYDLVRLGGKATDDCYDNIFLQCDWGTQFEHLIVLLLSGYYPTKAVTKKNYSFLDQLANIFIDELDKDENGEESMMVENQMHIEILGILYKIVKLGDNLSCGPIDSTVINNINQLPSLEAGRTHSKGGSMEQIMKQFPMKRVQDLRASEVAKVVLEFFEKLNLFIENGADPDDTLEEMIKTHPYLVNAKCPHEIGEVGAGDTVMEAICSCQSRADTCEFLEELVRLGGQATDECYEGLDWSYVMPLEELQVLLVSGYIPKKLEKDERFFLDVLANGLDVDEEEDDVYEEDKFWFLSILYKLVKLGDWLRFGETRSQVFIDNINKLPPLEIGVTHQKGGSLDKLIKRFPVETVIEFNKQNRAQKEAYKKEQEIKRKKQEEDCKRKAQVMEQRKKEEEKQRLAREKEKDDRKRKAQEREQKRKEKQEKQRSAMTRTCSACQVTKSTTEFSKNQRGKGDAAKCKGCIAVMQQGLKGKAKAQAEPKQKETISMSVGDNAVLASEEVKKPMSSNTQKPKEQNTKLSWRQMYLSGSRA